MSPHELVATWFLRGWHESLRRGDYVAPDDVEYDRAYRSGWTRGKAAERDALDHALRLADFLTSDARVVGCGNPSEVER